MWTASSLARANLSIAAGILGALPVFALAPAGARDADRDSRQTIGREATLRGAGNALAMAVATTQSCYGSGDTVCYTLSMQDLEQPVTGFQAFLEFDPTQLSFNPGASSYTFSPFGLHVQSILTAEVAPGELNLDGAVDFSIPQPPTSADALLVTLCFTVLPGNGGETADILNRSAPPFVTTLSLNGDPVATIFVPSGGVLLDETPPTLTCPAGQSLHCITQLPAPIAPADPNLVTGSDSCAGAPSVCNGTYFGSTAAATNDSSGSCGAASLSADTWFRFTPGGNGVLTVSTCGAGTNFDTVLSIHADICPATPQTELACSDAGCGPAAEVSAAVSAGVTYLIRVAGAGGATGGFELSVDGPSCLGAADNCDPQPVVTWVGDVDDGQTCPKTITRTYRATDIGGNFAECEQVFTIDDPFDPVIICPDKLDLDCATPLPLPANTLADFVLQGGFVTDNCGVASVTMESELLVSGTGCASDPFYFLRVYRAVDGCGNDRVCKQSIFQWDMFPPSITCPGDVTIQCHESSLPANTGVATATDNCGVPAVTYTDVEDLDDCLNTGTITRTWRATDGCGQFTECVQVITVIDNTPPLLTCASDISVNADSGCDGAIVTYADPAVSDNCDMAPVLLGCGPASGGLFPIGVTTVTCTAQDACGNIGSCEFDVTVGDQNTVTVTVALEGVIANTPLTRCIKFIAKSGMSCSAPVHVEVEFLGNPATGTATFDVECGDWTELCAKDEQHTLYDTVALNDLGNAYQAAATLELVGGDTDNDSDVDINDVTFLLFTFGGPEAVGGCPWNVNRGADFNNDGTVFVQDYTFLTENWLQLTTCNCGVLNAAVAGEGPKSSISADELPAEVARKADRNRDGVIDHRDVADFERAAGLPSTLSQKLRASGRASAR